MEVVPYLSSKIKRIIRVYEKETKYFSRNCYKFDSFVYQFLLRYNGSHYRFGLS